MPLRFRVLIGMGIAVVVLAAVWAPDGTAGRSLLAVLFVLISLAIVVLASVAARGR